ncbi:MAG: tRNA-dihydrouridine synthase [Deltaproteobacteria bacterium]|nr:tRNA-dihydrouridine synthase [Deltaproteobacteria bacterium]
MSNPGAPAPAPPTAPQGPAIGAVKLSNPFALAPMAGLTTPAYRLLAAEAGAALTESEMVSAIALAHRGQATARFLTRFRDDATVPFAVQLFGKDPATMAAAARIAQDERGADLIDLNMGCPARQVVRSGHGAALLKTPDLLLRIVEKVAASVSVPVIVKTRPGFNPPPPGQDPPILALAPRLSEAGAAALTLHGRYASQGFTGQADWEIVRAVAETGAIPTIGSGDIASAPEALRRLAESKALAVMLGRATRGRPWLFSECRDLWEGRVPAPPEPLRALRCARRHALLLWEEMGPRSVFPLRGILAWYIRELPGAAAFRARINREENFPALLEILDQAFNAACPEEP